MPPTSSATITAIVVLESPRRAPDSPKTIFFDGQIYQGAGQPLLAAFRYWNADDMVFDDVGFYFLHATVSSVNWYILQSLMCIGHDRLRKWCRVQKYHLLNPTLCMI